MTDKHVEAMANQLLAEGFERSGPAAQVLSDPIVDTPMLVTLDQLRPYDLNPRVTRNPRFDEIKASIRERGLESAPAITRRPGAPTYLIRNGGNTRLAILRELWTETKNEQFYRIACLFRPWPQRGEIMALTGHLAENELRGSLSFIERALGIEKVRELYEVECGSPLSQSELARRLNADGYPIQQSHISRMRDAVLYLLPAIPNVLYGGLGRHQVERLAVLRRSGERTWEEHTKGKTLGIDFPTLFQDALVLFDGETKGFSLQQVQDELIGQMVEWLGLDYDTLALKIDVGERRQQALEQAPQQQQMPEELLRSPPLSTPSPESLSSTNRKTVPHMEPSNSSTGTDQTSSPPITDRLQSIQQMVSEYAGEFPTTTSGILPLSQDSLFPISDIWSIEPGLNAPERLRIHISQFAREIAQDVAQAGCITAVDEGIGFHCSSESSTDSLMTLLKTLTTDASKPAFPVEMGPLLLGSTTGGDTSARLSDVSLIKLFRLIRLARRLIDLKSNPHHTERSV